MQLILNRGTVFVCAIIRSKKLSLISLCELWFLGLWATQNIDRQKDSWANFPDQNERCFFWSWETPKALCIQGQLPLAWCWAAPRAGPFAAVLVWPDSSGSDSLPCSRASHCTVHKCCPTTGNFCSAAGSAAHGVHSLGSAGCNTEHVKGRGRQWWFGALTGTW